jgi:hypothetical protein
MYKLYRPCNFKLGMVIVQDQQKTPIDVGGQGVKGQGQLVGKNDFRSITKERLGLAASNLV